MAEDFEKGVQQHQKDIDFEMRYEEANVQHPSARLFKAEHRRIFFDRVNAARKDLKALAQQVSPPKIDFFVQNSQEKINAFLKNVAETGRRVLKAKNDRKGEIADELPSIETLSAQLQVELDFIAEDVDTFRKIKAAENDFEEAKNAEKNDAGIQGKMDVSLYLNQAKSKLTYDLHTPTTSKYYKELFDHIEEKLAAVEKELYALRLEYDPPAYIQMVKDDFEKEARARISDEKLLHQTVQRFNDGIVFYTGYLLGDNLDEKKQATLDLDAFMRKSIENISFDQVIVAFRGRTFKCRFDPQLPASEFEKSKQRVNNVVEIYMQNLEDKEIRLSEWNEKIAFINGTMKVRLDYGGPLQDFKSRGRFLAFVVTPGAIELTDSSREAEEKKVKVASFKSAFENWRNSSTSESGFWYDNPPVYVDMAKHLKSKGVEKNDFVFDFFHQEGIAEFMALAQYQHNGDYIRHKVFNYTYTKEGERNYLSKKKVFTHVLVDPDFPRVETVEYYKPSELQEYKKVLKNYVGQVYRDQQYLEEFNKDGKLMRREIQLPSCPGISAVYYNNGKPIEDAQGELLDEVKVVLEWNEGGEKKTFLSFPAMKEINPKFTEEQYLEYSAKMLTTDALHHAWSRLMFEYVYDSPDPKNPLKSGSSRQYGNYFQSPEETVRRTKNGKSLGDCDDVAILSQDRLARQGKSAYVLHVPAHMVAVAVSYDKSTASYTLKTYDNDGVTINGSLFGHNDLKSSGYPSKAEALRAFHEASSKRGMPIRYMGMYPFPRYDRHSRDFVTVVAKISEKDDIWYKTFHKKEEGPHKVIYLHSSFFPNLDAGDKFILAVREYNIWLHQKGEVYYGLSVNPDWIKVNEEPKN